jgi:erythromycin esterase-like protein
MFSRGEYNLGHLCRKEFGDFAYAIGFGTHTGTVAAASNWDGPMEIPSNVVETPGEGIEGCVSGLSRAAKHGTPSAPKRTRRAYWMESPKKPARLVSSVKPCKSNRIILTKAS